MSKSRWLTIVVLLLVGIAAKAQDFPASVDASKPWSFSVDIAAPDGTYIMTGPQLYLLNGRRLLAIVFMDKYVTDAVSKGWKYSWLVSDNGGITWEPLQEKPADFVTLGPYKWPTRALRLPDGTLLATASPGWENFPESQREKLSAEGYGLFDHQHGNAPGIVSVCRKVIVSRSRDGGKTWDTHDAKLPFMAIIAIYGNAIVLEDGTYIQPVYGIPGLSKRNKDTQGGVSEGAWGDGWASSMVLQSKDRGDHWEVSTVAKGRDFDFLETSITQAPNGDLVAVMRTAAQKELWTAISNDDGKTWSAPRDSGMRGSTPWVVTTAKGRVVAVYSRRETKYFPTTGMYACVSRDNGQSWDVEHQAMIRDNGNAFVDGYPQAVALPDGSVFAVFGLILSVPAEVTTGEMSTESQLRRKLSNAQLSAQAIPRKKTSDRRLPIVGSRFSPAYEGPPVLDFDHAPGVLRQSSDE